MNFDWQQLTLFFGFLVESGVLAFMWKMYVGYQEREDKKAKERAKQDEAMQNAMRSILRNNIIAMCLQAEERGYIPLHDVEALNDAFECYEALGGNGTTKQLYEKTIQLRHKE